MANVIYPGWGFNIGACPTVDIQVGRHHVACEAHVADAIDVPRLWTQLDQVYCGYARSRERTERELPIVRLSPIEPTSSA